MSHEYSYAWEKLGNAVRALVGVGTLRERLIGAYAGGVTRLRAPLWPPPADLVERLEPLHAAIDRVQVDPDGRGTIVASIEAMTDDELEKLAEEFVRAYAYVCAKCGPTYAF